MIHQTPTSATRPFSSQVNTDAAQFNTDAELIDQLSQHERPTDDDLVTVARLRMRYALGPMRRRLDQLLLRWDISELALHKHTRNYWANYVQSSPTAVLYGSGADTD